MHRRSKSSTEPSNRRSALLWMSALAAGGALAVLLGLWDRSDALGWKLVARDTSVGVVQQSSTATTTAQTTRAGAPVLRAVTCTALLRNAVETISPGRELSCHRLSLGGQQRLHAIELSFVHIGCGRDDRRGAPDATECPAPVVVFAGGPGDSMVAGLDRRLGYFLPRVGQRGLIFIDARGTGTSKPRLNCPSTLARIEDLTRCYHRWDQEVDLDEFGSAAHVQDAAAVLDAVGLDRVAIYGVSYGTHLATEFARLYPERVEALVLDSPVPRTGDILGPMGRVAQDALRSVLRTCRDAGPCAPNVTVDALSELATQMDRRRVGGTAPPGSPTGTRFVSGLVQLLQAPAAIPYVPYLLLAAQRDDFDVFTQLTRAPSKRSDFAWGMHLSVQCKERFPLTNELRMGGQDQIVAAGLREALSARHYLSYCAEWRVRPQPIALLPAPLEVPTLVFSGEFDAVTPRSYAQTVVGDFEHSRLVSIPHVGHGAALSTCGGRIMRQFLDAPQSAHLDTACSGTLSFSLEPPSLATIEQIRRELYFRL